MSLVERPYIGVTGISEIYEAEVIAQTFPQALPESSSHQGMTGYLVSLHTLNGDKEKVTKYPYINNLPDLLRVTRTASLNTIHYRTPERATLAEQVAKLFDKSYIYADGLCQTLQLNIAWPDPDQIEKIKKIMPAMRFILALTPKIVLRESRFEIEDKLTDYRDIVDYVLIDPSGGIGEAFESNAVLPLYTSAKDIMRNQIVALGGGFNEKNVKIRLAEISELLRTKQFAIDAEGGLRDKTTSNPHAGILSLERAVGYINNAAAFFNS